MTLSFLKILTISRFLLVTNGNYLTSTNIDISDQEKDKLLSWFPTGQGPKSLLYRASRDGFASSDFHRMCDDKGPTLTMVKSEYGNIFGGYTSLSWAERSGYWANDDQAWLYLLRSQSYSAEKFPVKPGDPHSIQCNNNAGPTFGGGHDLYISSNCNVNTISYSNGGSSYSIPDTHNFKVIDYEVWIVGDITPSPTTKAPTSNPTTKSPTPNPTTKSPTNNPTTKAPTPNHATIPSSNGNYIGVSITQNSDEYTWSEANTFCEDAFGTQLATVLTAVDQSEIEGSVLGQFPQSTYSVWIGWKDINGIDIWLPCTATTCVSNAQMCSANNAVSAVWHKTILWQSQSVYNENNCGHMRVKPIGGKMGHWGTGDCTLQSDFICNAPNGKYGNGPPFICAVSEANPIFVADPIYKRSPAVNSDEFEWRLSEQLWESKGFIISVSLVLNMCVMFVVYKFCIKPKIKTHSYKYVGDIKEDIQIIDA